MAIKLQIRRDTLTNWNANSSVVLLEGEIGYVTDTRNMKIGDGTTIWSSLKYQAPYYTGTNSSLAITTLSVDQTNNRVGIGNSSPATTLDVTGQVRVRGGSSYSQPSDNASVINYDTTGEILTVDARSTAGTSNIVFRASTSGTGGERVRIRPSGNVLETNGIVTSNRTTAGTFVVSGDGAYAFGTDQKQYIYGKPGNDGNVAIYTTTSGGTTNDRLNVTSTAVQVKTALTTTSTATIGDTLTVSTGGLTVSAGTVTVPAGSIAGAALADNGVTFAKLPQVSTPSFIGTPAGTSTATNVSALTQAQARTMLGLIAASYTSPVTSNAVWTNTALSGSTTINLDLDVTTLGIGVINRIPISLGRSGGVGSASVFCRAIVEAGETLLILGGFDTGSNASFTGVSSGGGVCWFWGGVAWSAVTPIITDAQQVRALPMYAYSGSSTVNVLRWGQITATAPQVSAEVIAIRIS